jgi:ATP-dependent Lon protease
MLEALANETPANIEQDDARSKSINKTKKESKSNKIKVADMLEALAKDKPNKIINFVVHKDLVGVSYEGLFAGKLEGSKLLTLVDTYIRNNQQLENLDEFLSMYRKITPKIEQCEVHLLTKSPKDNQTVSRKHEMDLQQIKKKFAGRGVKLTIEFNDDIHARSIKADNGCKISLDLGLDIFQKSEYIKGHGYLKPQKERLCKKFELVFLRW